MSKKTYEVAWICDGKVKDCNQTRCFFKTDQNGRRGPCSHTMDATHARLKAIDPKDDPERFDKFKYGDQVRYYEKTEYALL